jgi:hypothetical protein
MVFVISASGAQRTAGIAALAGLACSSFGGCAGTEADNPVTEPAFPTPCKSKGDYAEFRLAAARYSLPRGASDLGGWSLQSTPPAQSSAEQYASSGAGLTPSAAFPSWLSCVEWNLGADGTLGVQVVNYRSGCAIEWAASSSLAEDGALELRIENPTCSVAACGNCYYDFRARQKLESPGDLVIRLTEVECLPGGDDAIEEWHAVLLQQPHGMLCEATYDVETYFENSNTSPEQRHTYAVCGESARANSEALGTDYTVCSDGYTCVADRCVTPCTNRDDCTLLAFECRDGFCRLPD